MVVPATDSQGKLRPEALSLREQMRQPPRYGELSPDRIWESRL